MRRVVLSSVVAACLALVGSQAHADDINLTGFVRNPASVLNLTGGPVNYTDEGSGQFMGTYGSNASFQTYCTDLAQTFSFNTTYTDYTVIGGVMAFGADKSLALDELMSAAIRAGFPFDADSSALIQAAIWEIIYETSGSYDFASGSFTVTSNNATTQNYLSTAINFGGLPFEPVTYHVDQLHSDNSQDFLVITAVPEPSTYALMFAGLAGMAFVARRRSQR